MSRYVVIENTPGYLPEDDDPYATDDLEAAREYLGERVESYCDFLCEGYDYAEDYQPDVYWSEDRSFVMVSDPNRAHDLGRYFSIELTEDESC